MNPNCSASLYKAFRDVLLQIREFQVAGYSVIVPSLQTNQQLSSCRFKGKYKGHPSPLLLCSFLSHSNLIEAAVQ